MGAINKLVMRAQSRMVMWGKITCCVREKRKKEREGVRNRGRSKIPGHA